MEATRALRAILRTRHLQQVPNALPSAPVPNPSDGSSTATGRGSAAPRESRPSLSRYS
ncbi:hypothetical protein DFH06DRAFT_1320757 [Mycena polygramma]|nr:hypothetical protein DFH06DRAFT_1320757 [Mycena polygramma]